MRLGRTTFLHFISQVVVSAAGFASRFVIAVLLGEAVLGRYSVIVALGFFWLPIVGTAISRGVSKRVSEGSQRGAFLAAGFGVNAVVAAATVGIVFAASHILEVFSIGRSMLFVDVLLQQREVIALLAISAIAFRSSMSGLVGFGRVVEQGALTATERLLRATIQIALVLASAGLFGLAVGHATSLFVVAGIGILLYRTEFSVPSWKHVRGILRFSRYDWASTFQGHIFGWMDIIVLSFFVSDGFIGIYEVAWGLGSLLGTLSASIRSTLFPELSGLAAEGKYDRIRHVLGEGIVLSGLLVIPGLFGAAAIGERVLEIYRPSFGKGAEILVILVAAYLADVYGSQFVDALNALDMASRTYRINLLFVGLNLILNVLLVWQFGWYGAAVATAVSAGVRTVLSYRQLTDILSMADVPVTQIAWQFVSSGLMLTIVVPMSRRVPMTRLWTVAVVLTGAAVYGLCVFSLSSLVRVKVIGLVRTL